MKPKDRLIDIKLEGTVQGILRETETQYKIILPLDSSLIAVKDE